MPTIIVINVFSSILKFMTVKPDNQLLGTYKNIHAVTVKFYVMIYHLNLIVPLVTTYIMLWYTRDGHKDNTSHL
jgi:hypothetical protein